MKAIIFSAHSDDFVIGAGGYIAQHPKQTHCVVFSMGEMSHPWLKPKEIKKIRRNETYQAAKILRTSVTPYDLTENNFLNENEKLINTSCWKKHESLCKVDEDEDELGINTKDEGRINGY